MLWIKTKEVIYVIFIYIEGSLVNTANANKEKKNPSNTVKSELATANLKCVFNFDMEQLITM